MKEDPEMKALTPFDFDQIRDEVPEIRKFSVDTDTYTFSPLIDSSDVEPSMWQELARVISNNYDRYDGFIVLHGTDTMAYSASALSFMLDGLSKPVIFTGSQLPIGVQRTDGKENLISSVEIAAAKDSEGHALVPEVSICFGSKLLRGNRSTKVDSEMFGAFQSPNLPPLAEAGISIRYNKGLIIKPSCWDAPLRVNSALDTSVSILKVHPGITPHTVSNILLGSNTRAVIIETYGAGNAPTAGWFLDCVRQADRAGKVLVNVTQCLRGTVDMNLYATGKALQEAGVVNGYDSTTEAALAKLFVLLGSLGDNEEVKCMMDRSLKGEISK